MLYDRPAKLFTRLKPTVSERHDLLSRINYSDFFLFTTLVDSDNVSNTEEISTIQTVLLKHNNDYSDKISKDDNNSNNCYNDDNSNSKENNRNEFAHLPVLRGDRAKILVSATSWTADENFSILIEALLKLEDVLQVSHITINTSY